jgi:hypothetical protein
MSTTSLMSKLRTTKDNIYVQSNTNNRQNNRYRNNNFINRFLRTTDQRFIELKSATIAPYITLLIG